MGRWWWAPVVHGTAWGLIGFGVFASETWLGTLSLLAGAAMLVPAVKLFEAPRG